MSDKPSRKVPQSADPPENRPLDAPGETVAMFYGPRRQPTGDPYDLERLFLEWAWFTQVAGGWPGAVRLLARALRGLQGAGLIERSRVRRHGHATHHGFVLTDLGQEALQALSGDWVKDADGEP